MRAVDVHLDAGLRLRLAVGVAADVVPPLEDEDLQPELGGAAFGDRQSEEAGSDDDEISVQGGSVQRSCSWSRWHAGPAGCRWPAGRRRG